MSKKIVVDKKAGKAEHKTELAAMEKARKDEKKYLKTLSKKEKRAFLIDKQRKLDENAERAAAIAVANGGKARRTKKTTKKNGMPKKKHKLLCCTTSILLTLVLVVGGTFTTVGILYTSYVKPTTEISFFEMLGVTIDMYNADECEIVTNAFDAKKDSAAFYNGLSKALQIDTVLTIDDILSGLTGGGEGEQPTDSDAEPDPKAEPNPDDSTGNSAFDKILKDTKFDFSSLVNFDGKTKPSFSMTDKMLGAVLNDALNISSGVPMLAGIEKTLGMPIKDAVSAKQVIITTDPNNITAATFKATLAINVRAMVANILKPFGLPDFLTSMISGMSPKTIYVSLSLDPTSIDAPEFQINSIDKEMMARLVRALDNLMGKSGDTAGGAFTSILTQVSGFVNTAFTKVHGLVGDEGISFASTDEDASMNVDVLQAMMSIMNVKNVSSTDFLLMIKHLHSVDNKINADNTIDDYITSMVKNKTDMDIYNAEIIRFLNYYGVDTSNDSDKKPFDIKEWSPSNFSAKIPFLPTLINPFDFLTPDGDRKIDYLDDEKLDEMALISDAAVGQIIQAQLSIPGQLPFGMHILELNMMSDHMKIIASFNIADLFGTALDSNPLKSLISSLFPENLFVEVTAFYDKASTSKSNIIFNFSGGNPVGNSQLESDKMLKTLATFMSAFGMDSESIDKATLLQKLDDNIKIALDSLTDVGTSPVGGVPIGIGFTEGGIKLPTIIYIAEQLFDLIHSLTNSIISQKNNTLPSNNYTAFAIINQAMITNYESKNYNNLYAKKSNYIV